MRLNYTSYRSKKLFCFLLSLLTILNGYAFFFAGTFSIAMMIATVYALAGVFKWFTRNNAKGIFYSPILLLIFFIMLTLLSVASLYSSQIHYSALLYDISKIGVWATMISLAGYFYFDYKIFAKYMIRVAVVATVLLIAQVIAITFLKISIPNAFDLGIIRPAYIEYGYSIDYLASQIRLSSFWMEPAQYGNYILAALAIGLFDRNTQIRNRKLTIYLFVFGILLSTSSGAIYMMLIFFMLYFLRSNAKNKIIVIFLLTVSLCVVFIFSNFSMLEQISGMGKLGYSVYRALTKIELWRDSARIGASFDVISSLSDYGIHKYIGLGVGNEIELLNSINREFSYLNSFAKTVTWTGYFGVMAYIMFFVSLIKRNRTNRIGRVLSLFCFIGGFYSGLWYSPDSIVFYIIAIYSIKKSSMVSPEADHHSSKKQILKGM